MANALHCPACGSTKYIKFGTRFGRKDPKTGKRPLLQRYSCKNCGEVYQKPVRPTREKA